MEQGERMKRRTGWAGRRTTTRPRCT